MIVDNASVHGGDDSLEGLFALLDQHKIRIVFLPAYSPELNPAELVFNQVKTDFKYNRQFDDLYQQLLWSLLKIDRSHMISFYKQSLVNWVYEI